MTTNSADDGRYAEHPRPLSVEELAHQQGVFTVKTVDDLADDEIFSSDDEVNEFLTFVRQQRDASLA